jgi:hypothetical protein
LKGGGGGEKRHPHAGPGLQYQAAVKFDSKFKYQSNSNYIQICSKFDGSKKDFPELEKIQIKYGCECFEEKNNFIHSNFSKFKMDFELKIWEVKV